MSIDRNKLLSAFEKAYRQPHIVKLLTPRWRKENQGAPPSTGFCYLAAEVAFCYFKDQQPKPMCASYIENGQPCTHWWIKLNDGSIFDPTATQYPKLGLQPPYHLGKGKGFLTKYPSNRASKLWKEVRKYL